LAPKVRNQGTRRRRRRRRRRKKDGRCGNETITIAAAADGDDDDGDCEVVVAADGKQKRLAADYNVPIMRDIHAPRRRVAVRCLTPNSVNL